MKKYLTIILFFAISVSVKSQTTIIDSITSDGLTRYYTLYVPAAYDGSEEVPIVLNLHGYGSAAFQQIFYGEFRPIADTANFIMLVPDGTQDLLGFQFWNTFVSPGIGVDDASFISNLLDTIIAEYSIDERRIYSTGMSNGGFMSYELACTLSNRIAAIASVTGSIVEARIDFCDPQHPMPVMEIHGTNDLTVPYDGGGISDFVPIPEIVEYWAEFNNCNMTPTITDIPDIDPGDGSTVQHFVYSGGTNGATVEHFKVINGGHTWPGTIFLIPSSGSTNKDINASAEIWRFFSQYQLDDLTNQDEILAEELSLDIFPNPVSDIFTLISPIEILGSDYQLINLMGQTVKSGYIDSKQTNISVKNLPEGQYIFRVNSTSTPIVIIN